METQEQQSSGPSSKGEKKAPKRESSGFVQQFGPGMTVSHSKYGIGHVNSSHRHHVSVHFYCDGQDRNLKGRSLSFTREENIRRSEIRKAMDRGKAVTVACASETQVVHRLLGFGVLHSIDDDGSVWVTFDTGLEFVDLISASELRLAPPPPPKKKDDNKKRRRW